MNLHALRGRLEADGGGEAICGAVGSYLANKPDDVNCAACLGSMTECTGCGEACADETIVVNADGMPLCEGCADDEEHFLSSFDPAGGDA